MFFGSAAYLKMFFKEAAPNFDIFSCMFFSGRIILKHIENKKGSIRFKIVDRMYSLKTLLKKAGGEDASPTSYPGSVPVIDY